MALARLAEESAAGVPWQTCSVCHALATIPPEEAAGLRSLLKSGMRYSLISEKIAADPDTPLTLDRQALSRHARGQCSAKEKLR